MALSELRGRWTVPATAVDFGMDDQTLTIDTGAVYIQRQDGDTSNQLCERVESAINAVAGYTTSTCSYDAVAGVVTIQLTKAANITWDDADLGLALGYQSAALENAITHTADRTPRHVWRPARAMSRYPTDATQLWTQKSSTVAGRSIDGTTYTVPGTSTDDAEVEFPLLKAAQVVTPAAGTSYNDFQQWFLDVIHAGELIRFVPDRTSTDIYRTAIFGDEEDEEIGPLEDYISKRQTNNNVLWTVRVPMMKKV